jgi:hypothetical protein
VGIFGYTGGAEINSLKVVYGVGALNSGTNSQKYVGAVVGYAADTRLDGISLSGSGLSLTGSNSQLWAGGIAGFINNASEISGCASSLPVTAVNSGTHSYIGGLAGQNDGTIKRSYTTGAVSGQGSWVWTGGLVGTNNSLSFIELSYASGAVNANVSGEGSTGGLAGAAGGLIRDCYASGAASSTGAGSQYIGGLGGDFNGTIERSYASGTVSSSGGGILRTGGLVGNSYAGIGTISASAALNQSVGTGTSRRVTGSSALTLANNYAFQGMTVNGGTVGDTMPTPENHIDGLGKSASELKQQSAYQAGLGWDFTGVWEMGPPAYPYPILKWQNGVVHIPSGFTVIN